MYLYHFISIIFILFASSLASLSVEFVATSAPSGISHYGKTKIYTVCDPTRECKTDTQNRNKCQRWNCCWNPLKNTCFEKKHFIISPGEPTAQYEYEVIENEFSFDDARSECKGKGMDLAQFNPKLYSKAGRQEIADSISMPIGAYYHLGLKRYEDDNNMWKRVADEQVVTLEGWRTDGAYPKPDPGTDFVYWDRFWADYEIYNDEHYDSWVICEKVIMS